jgi:hypothetical protein
MSFITEPLATVIIASGWTTEAHSALPWSPVVPEPEPRAARLAQVRLSTAGLLETLADAVRPREPVCHLAPGQ